MPTTKPATKPASASRKATPPAQTRLRPGLLTLDDGCRPGIVLQLQGQNGILILGFDGEVYIGHSDDLSLPAPGSSLDELAEGFAAVLAAPSAFGRLPGEGPAVEFSHNPKPTTPPDVLELLRMVTRLGIAAGGIDDEGEVRVSGKIVRLADDTLCKRLHERIRATQAAILDILSAAVSITESPNAVEVSADADEGAVPA